MGKHEFDPARFSDPKGMVDAIHDLNARFMISVWPKFYPTTKNYKELAANGWVYLQAVKDSILDFVPPGFVATFYDAYAPGARKLFWKQMNDNLYRWEWTLGGWTLPNRILRIVHRCLTKRR